MTTAVRARRDLRRDDVRRDGARARAGAAPCTARLATVAAAFVLAAVAAACLPSGTRSQGSGATGSGASSPAFPTGSAGPTPRRSFVPPTPTPAPTFLVHVVAKGESLNTIAHKYGTSARSIAFWNRATYPSLDPESAAYRPDLLKLGWTLFLIPNLILTDDEAPPLPSAVAPDASNASDDPGAAADEPSDSAIPE